MSLTREQVLSAEDGTRERVDVPEWAPKGTDPKDSYVWVMTLACGDFDRYEQSMLFARKKSKDEIIGNIRTALLVRCIVDDNGVPLFTLKDIEALGKKSIAPLNRCYDVASRLNGQTKADVEELEKNSESDPSESS